MTHTIHTDQQTDRAGSTDASMITAGLYADAAWVRVYGTFDGSAVLEERGADGEWRAIENGTFTAAAAREWSGPGPIRLNITLVSGTLHYRLRAK